MIGKALMAIVVVLVLYSFAPIFLAVEKVGGNLSVFDTKIIGIFDATHDIQLHHARSEPIEIGVRHGLILAVEIPSGHLASRKCDNGFWKGIIGPLEWVNCRKCSRPVDSDVAFLDVSGSVAFVYQVDVSRYWDVGFGVVQHYLPKSQLWPEVTLQCLFSSLQAKLPLSYRPIQEHDANKAKHQTRASGKKQPLRPKRHVLLGLQVLVGCLLLIVSFKMLFKAADKFDSEDFSAGIAYCLCGLSAIFFGISLVVRIGFMHPLPVP